MRAGSSPQPRGAGVLLWASIVPCDSGAASALAGDERRSRRSMPIRLTAHRGPQGQPVLLVDSITQIDAGTDAGAWVVSGSHGGCSSASYALAVPLALAVFNDAGVGKDEAGITALGLLQDQGRAAVTVAHGSARIGDARDTWEAGVISRANAAARALGLDPGLPLQAAIRAALDR